MMAWAKRNKKGFNLVETIVASTILSGAVLALGTIGTRSLIGARLNRQYEVAASLINKQLSLIDYVGIDQFVEMGQLEGEFPDLEPGYQWEVTSEYQDIDSLYLIRITVTWLERNRPYSLTVETMLDGVSAYTNPVVVQQ